MTNEQGEALVTAAEQEQLDLDRKLVNFLDRTKKTWALSNKASTAVSASMSMLATKHGFYSAIPIVCKGDTCPYKATCEIQRGGLAPEGEPCPVEIAKIFTLYENYSEELQIKENDEIDKTLLKDLINTEIQLSRCDAKVAEEGDFVQLVAFAVAEDGTILEKPELSKAVEFREKALKKKYDILRLLNSTRKDKADSNISMAFSPTQIVEDLMAKAKEFDSAIEVPYEDNKEESV
jgi:hypothetical protein